MIIGSPQRFAIQYDIGETESKFLNGKFSYILGGLTVGDYESGASIAVAVEGIKRELANRGRRVDELLLGMPADAAFHTIRAAMYDDDSRSDEQVRADLERYSVFEIARFSDAFDHLYCFLVEGRGLGRFLLAELKKIEDVREVVLGEGEFDDVSELFLSSVSQACGNLG